MTLTAPPNLNDNIDGLKPSATLLINEQSKQLIAEGKKVYRLGFGQSPFPVPKLVVEALRRHADEKDYLNVKGLPALRQAVALHTQREIGINAYQEDVLIGPGSKELIFNLQAALDADLLLPSPSWVSYEPQAHILNKSCHWLDTFEKDGWRLLPENLDSFCRKNPDRSKLLILNYPNNPVGNNYPADWMEALAQTVRRHQVFVLADEIYSLVSHSAPHTSMAKFYPEGTLLSSGLSKWAGAGGWRLGTLVFPSQLRWLLDAMAGIASETFSAVAAPIQYAAVAAYQENEQLTQYRRDILKILRAVGEYTFQQLKHFGLSMPAPEGGFYLFPNFEKYRASLAKKGIHTSTELCQALLNNTGVALLPGSAFGRPPVELTARLSYVDFDGSLVLNAFANKHEEASMDHFVQSHCPNIPAAMEALGNFLEALT